MNIIYLPPKFYHRHFTACVLAYLSIPPRIQSFFILWPFKVNCRQPFIHFRLNTSACMSLRRLQCSFTFFSFDLKFISNEMHASEADFLLSFGKFVHLGNPNPYQDTEHYRPAQKFPHAPSRSVPAPTTSQRQQLS